MIIFASFIFYVTTVETYEVKGYLYFVKGATMFTLLYSINKINGAEIGLLGYFICLVLFISCYLLFKKNRGKIKIFKGIIGLIVCSVVCDIIWFLYYFPDGNYYNHGLAGSNRMLLWPLFLIILLIGLTIYNRRK